MSDIKYIYFETVKIFYENDKRGSIGDHPIRNVNVLKFRPDHLNSDGFWVFLNFKTEYKSTSSVSFVKQNWIDVDLFESKIIRDPSRHALWKSLITNYQKAMAIIKEMGTNNHERNL